MKSTPFKPRVKPLSGILRTAKLPASAKPKLAAKPRMRKCEICKTPFVKRSMTHKACSPVCAAVVARSDREKAARKELAVRREAIKPRAKWLSEAQAAVNAYVRERDAALPCVSCGRHHQGQWHAGHYLSVGAHPALRFCEINIAKQCKPCNVDLSGNVLRFRAELINRIGQEQLDWLEGPHQPAKHTIDDAKAIKAEYKAKLKALQAERSL